MDFRSRTAATDDLSADSEAFLSLTNVDPAELWALPDQHHNGSITQKSRSAVWEADIHAFVCDWLRERFNGVPVKHPGKSLWVEPSGAGPNAPGVSYQRRWFD